jgi:hypothetical protein
VAKPLRSNGWGVVGAIVGAGRSEIGCAFIQTVLRQHRVSYSEARGRTRNCSASRNHVCFVVHFAVQRSGATCAGGVDQDLLARRASLHHRMFDPGIGIVGIAARGHRPDLSRVLVGYGREPLAERHSG